MGIIELRYMHKKVKTQERICFPFHVQTSLVLDLLTCMLIHKRISKPGVKRINTRTQGAFYCPFTTLAHLPTYMFPVLAPIAKLQMYPPYSQVRSDNTHTNSENLSCSCRVLSHLLLVSTWRI